MHYSWNFTEEDYQNAGLILKNERISNLTDSNIFCAGIYCILSVSERYTKQIETYNNMISKNLKTPETILNNKELLGDTIKRTRFPNQKKKRICGFSEWYKESDLGNKIVQDVSNNRIKEFEIRNHIAENAPGLSYKASSFLMIKCGYDNVVPVDIWVIRFMNDIGCDVIIPDYKKESGPAKKEYIKYENAFSEISKDYKTTPAMLQAVVWGKASTWKETQ